MNNKIQFETLFVILRQHFVNSYFLIRKMASGSHAELLKKLNSG